MKKIVKGSAIVLIIIAHVPCSGMMTVYDKKNNNAGHLSMKRNRINQQSENSVVAISSNYAEKKLISYEDSESNTSSKSYLTFDGFVAVADRGADLKTKLCMRATDRHSRDTILIDDLLAIRQFMLKREPGFFTCVTSHINETYFLDGTMTKNRADALGWNYGPNAFTADGTLSNKHDGLWVSALKHHSNDNIRQLHITAYQNEQKLKRAFSLAKKLKDQDAQKHLFQIYIPNNSNGAADFSSLIFEEINQGNWDTAISFVKANPHGFCNNKHKENWWITSRLVGRHYVRQEGKKEELLKLALSQPRFPHQDHEHCTIL